MQSFPNSEPTFSNFGILLLVFGIVVSMSVFQMVSRHFHPRTLQTEDILRHAIVDRVYWWHVRTVQHSCWSVLRTLRH